MLESFSFSTESNILERWFKWHLPRALRRFSRSKALCSLETSLFLPKWVVIKRLAVCRLVCGLFMAGFKSYLLAAVIAAALALFIGLTLIKGFFNSTAFCAKKIHCRLINFATKVMRVIFLNVILFIRNINLIKWLPWLEDPSTKRACVSSTHTTYIESESNMLKAWMISPVVRDEGKL